MDLSVRIGSLTLKNPLIAASGCFGYGVEYADVVDLSSLGAIVSKGLFLKPREGHASRDCADVSRSGRPHQARRCLTFR